MVITALKFLALVAVSIFLTACHGRNDSANDVAPPSGRLVAITVDVDPRIPIAARNAITSIQSSEGVSSLPGSLPVRAPIDKASLLIAGNETTPYLLSFRSTDTALDVESTAKALVRIANGVVYPADISVANLESAIAATPTYPELLAAITSALEAGTAPIDSDQVIDLIWKVTTELAQNLEPSGAIVTDENGTKLLASIESVNQLPYYFFRDGPTDAVWLTNSSGNALTLNNRTPIYWRVTTAPSEGPSQIVAPPRKVTKGQLLAYYGGSESTSTIVGASPLFSVTISQDETSKLENGLQLVSKFAVILIDIAYQVDPGVGDACAKKVATALLNDKLPQLVAQPSAEAAYAYFKSATNIGNPVQFGKDVINYINGCPTTGVLSIPTTSTIQPDSAFVKSLTKILARLQFARSVFGAGDASWQMFKYYDYSQSVDVCKRNGVVAPCDFHMTIHPANPSIVIGGTIALVGTLLDSIGTEVPSPKGVIWRSDNTRIATINTDTGLVTGIAIGSATITATDRLTLTPTSTTISVVDPASTSGVHITSAECTPYPYANPELTQRYIIKGTATAEVQGTRLDAVPGNLKAYNAGHDSFDSLVCDSWTKGRCQRQAGDSAFTQWTAILNNARDPSYTHFWVRLYKDNGNGSYTSYAQEIRPIPCS
jgi:hypothetical protein